MSELCGKYLLTDGILRFIFEILAKTRQFGKLHALTLLNKKTAALARKMRFLLAKAATVYVDSCICAGTTTQTTPNFSEYYMFLRTWHVNRRIHRHEGPALILVAFEQNSLIREVKAHFRFGRVYRESGPARVAWERVKYEGALTFYKCITWRKNIDEPAKYEYRTMKNELIDECWISKHFYRVRMDRRVNYAVNLCAKIRSICDDGLFAFTRTEDDPQWRQLGLSDAYDDPEE